MTTIKKLLVTLSLATLLTACGSTDEGNENEVPTNAGYLSDYSVLKEVDMDDESITRKYKASDFDAAKYDSIIIEEIDFYPTLKNHDHIPADVAEQIRKYISDNTKSLLGKSFKITDQAGPATAKLRLAITGLTINDSELSAYQYVPIAFLFTAASGGLSEMSVKLQIDAELLDSTSGKVLRSTTKIEEGDNLDDENADLTFKHLEPLLIRWFKTFEETMKK